MYNKEVLLQWFIHFLDTKSADTSTRADKSATCTGTCINSKNQK